MPLTTRRAALLALAAGCSEPTHLAASVTIALGADDPAASVVTSTAQAYVWVDESYDLRDMVSGIDARLELDGAVAPLVETDPGRFESEPYAGLPERIRLLGDDESRELDRSVLFSATVTREENYVLVAIDPPVQEGEGVSLFIQPVDGSGAHSEPLVVGASRLELPSRYARIQVQRVVDTTEDSDGLRMSGTVRLTRQLTVPCWVGDPPPCP